MVEKARTLIADRFDPEGIPNPTPNPCPNPTPNINQKRLCNQQRLPNQKRLRVTPCAGSASPWLMLKGTKGRGTEGRKAGKQGTEGREP